MLDAGADKVSVNSAAVARPALVEELAARLRGPVRRAGDRCAKRVDGAGWEVFVAGGRTATGRDAVAWAREGVERGAGEILLTSMDRDGTKDGYDLALTRRGRRGGRVPVIASGGAGDAEHMVEGCSRRRRGAGRLDLPLRRLLVRAVKERLAAAGVAVRPPR